jgi:hypothetical protein
MFCTKLVITVAQRALFFGVQWGVLVASASENAEMLAMTSRRYLGEGTPESAIDHSVNLMVLAGALGVLVEISRSVRDRSVPMFHP